MKKGSAVGVVESVKAAYDLYSPVSGEILAVNEALNGKRKKLITAFGDMIEVAGLSSLRRYRILLGCIELTRRQSRLIY